MLELNFLAFCLTIIVITAIVYGKDEVAIKALSALSETTQNFLASFGQMFKHKGGARYSGKKKNDQM